MPEWPLLLLLVVLVHAAMLVAWVVQRRLGDAGIVDVAWSASIGCLAIVYALSAQGTALARTLAGVLGAAWAFRLAWHLLHDRVLGADAEDGRYRMLREHWGASQQWRMLCFFQLQAVAAWLLSIAVLVAASNASGPGPAWAACGVLVWLIAVAGETLADRQLASFRRDPANRGRTCRRGLWRYSRHPNYFFEWLHWFTYVFIAAGSPWWWVTLLGPAVMLWALLGVTGIPYTERQALKSRGDDYRDYQETTSAFLPWPPRRRCTT